MKVQLVSVRASQDARENGCPELTPELLAACGARYSRNNEGLDVILSKVDHTDPDKSVDSIFRMIDYGHQSIADMVPTAMFIDNISIWLAYLVWSYCPTAGGQESSTRYIRLSRDGVAEPSDFGIEDCDLAEWNTFIERAFEKYNEAIHFWEEVALDNPSATKIPAHLLGDSTERAQKQVARMKRNFAFDRSRYFLPVAALTNMMLIMSARGWVQLCQMLRSHFHPEARKLGVAVSNCLQLNSPRLVKHAVTKPNTEAGLDEELRLWANNARVAEAEGVPGEASVEAHVRLLPPPGVSDEELSLALQFHDNRYAWTGDAARMSAIQFGWTAVAMAEVRDLNRHRTGSKSCPLVPRGFYCCSDQAEQHGMVLPELLSEFGQIATTATLKRLSAGSPSFAAFGLLGHQYTFDHVTTLDKYIYEAELRTGTGAHFRYADHFKQSLSQLATDYPKLAGAIRIGQAEPE